MPVYTDRCEACGREAEDIRSVSAPQPECCGRPTVKVPASASFAFKTKGGNLFNFSPSSGRVTKGNRRPKVITRGIGLGGRRKPPRIRTEADGKVHTEVVR
jgi:putative FmdB family regulatory protein